MLASLLFTLTVCVGSIISLWSTRRSTIHRLILLNLFIYGTWALTILLTVLSGHFEVKLFLTKARLLIVPLLGPTWLLIGFGIFYRDFWQRAGNARYLAFLFPVLVIIGHACSLANMSFARQWTFYDYSINEYSQFGLLKYQAGILINLCFAYIYVCMCSLNVLHFFMILTRRRDERNLAMVLAGALLLANSVDIIARLVMQKVDLVQVGVAAAWPAALVLLYVGKKVEVSMSASSCGISDEGKSLDLFSRSMLYIRRMFRARFF